MLNKRYKKSLEKVDKDKIYNLDQGLQLALDTATSKFDESIDLAVKLGVDGKQSDQQVRGAVKFALWLGKESSGFGFCQR